MNRPRLRENSSTPPSLQKGDVIVATAMPASAMVHQFHIILFDDGRVQSAERIIGKRRSIYHTEFHNECDDVVSHARALLTQLIPVHSRIHDGVDFGSVDPFEYETNDRRLLQFWRGDRKDGCRVWSDQLYENLEIPKELVVPFRDHFDAIWQVLISQVRPILCRPDDVSPEGAWPFPLRTVEDPQ